MTLRPEPGADPLASLPPQEVRRPARVSDELTRQLQGLIFDGHLRPGAVIKQEALSAHFGVSRTPLREALRQLQQDGLIRVSDSGVASVADYSDHEAREMLELRELIDGLAARTLAKKGVTADVEAELRRLDSAMQDAARKDDKLGFLTRNADFHVLILEASGHSALQQFRTHLRITSQALYLRRGHQPLRHQKSSQEHHAIMRAIVSGKATTAERLAREHIVAAAEHWLGEGAAE